MPIYEFYCEDCHTVFGFLASTATRRRPACPRCGRSELPRRPSTFAIASAGADADAEEDDALFGGVDEDRLEGAMQALMGEMDGMGEDADPRSVGRLMRRFGELSGLEPGPKLEAALARLESGEDLEAVEADLEDGGDDDTLEDLFRLKRRLGRSRRPRVDDEIHFL